MFRGRKEDPGGYEEKQAWRVPHTSPLFPLASPHHSGFGPQLPSPRDPVADRNRPTLVSMATTDIRRPTE